MTGVSNNCSYENMHTKIVTLFKVLLYSQLKAVHAIWKSIYPKHLVPDAVQN